MIDNQEVLLSSIPLESLRGILKECIREEFKNLIPVPTSTIPKEDELLKIQDLARIFKVSKVTIHKWINDGVLPTPIRKGSRVFFKKSEIYKCFNVER